MPNEVAESTPQSLRISAPGQLLGQVERYPQPFLSSREMQRGGGRRHGMSGPQSSPLPTPQAPEVERPCRETHLLPQHPPTPAPIVGRPETGPLVGERAGCWSILSKAPDETGIWEPRAIRSCLAPVSCQLSQLSLRRRAWHRRWALSTHHLPPAGQQPGRAPGVGSHFPAGEMRDRDLCHFRGGGGGDMPKILGPCPDSVSLTRPSASGAVVLTLGVPLTASGEFDKNVPGPGPRS